MMEEMTIEELIKYINDKDLDFIVHVELQEVRHEIQE